MTTAPLGDVASWEMSAGMDPIAGGVVSCTVTVNVAVEWLPAASVAVQVTVVVVIEKVDPDAGAHVTPTEPETASLADGLVNVTEAPDVEVASAVMFAGTLLITGPVVSTTVILKVAVLLFPCESVALHVTVCWPRAKVAPEVASQPEVVTESSGSVNDTEKLTAAPAELVASAVMSAGTPMFGGVESHGPTVTLNVAEEELLRVSLAEQVTRVVVPAAKVEPEAGLQLTGLEPSTRSVAVGSV